MKVIEITGKQTVISQLETLLVRQGVKEKIAFLADIIAPYNKYNRIFALLEGEVLIGGMVLALNFASPIWLLAADDPEALMHLYLRAKEIEPEGMFFLTAREYQQMETKHSFHIEEVLLQMQRDPQVLMPVVNEELGLVIEQVDPEDLDQLDAFYQTHYYHAWHRDSFHLGPIFWIRREGKIIAVASCQSRYQDQIMIGNIFVLPEERGLGLGQAIVVKLTSALERKGIQVGLFVDEENEKAIGLYQKLGFAIFQRRIFVF